MTTFNATWDLSDVKKNGATESSHDSVIVATAKRAQPRLSPPVPSSGQKTKQASWNVAELTRLVESWLTAAPNQLGSAELIDTGPFGLAIEALADELLLLNAVPHSRGRLRS